MSCEFGFQITKFNLALLEVLFILAVFCFVLFFQIMLGHSFGRYMFKDNLSIRIYSLVDLGFYCLTVSF